MNKTGNHNLKKQEINIYREIQRNTEMDHEGTGMPLRTKSTTTGWQPWWRNRNYSTPGCMTGQCRIWWRARPRPTGECHENMMLRFGIGYNTLLNTSTSHIAENDHQGAVITVCWRWRRCWHINEEVCRKPCRSLAKELIEMENANIRTLKEYL